MASAPTNTFSAVLTFPDSNFLNEKIVVLTSDLSWIYLFKLKL